MTSNTERRKQARISVRWPITIITDQGTAEGESRNITASGIFVHCHEPLTKEKIYQIIVKIPKQNPIVVKGKVVWSNLDGLDENTSFPGMGFYFLQLSKEDKEFLNRLISSRPEI